MTAEGKVLENAVHCVCLWFPRSKVEALTQLLTFAAGIVGWCPVQYIPWTLYLAALFPLILCLMLQSRSWRHVPVVIEPLMAPLQLLFVASLFTLNWTRIVGISSPMSSNVTDSKIEFSVPL